ncbi:unnamed protein product, partial [Symbiodinium microadriaticum]
VVPLCNYGIPVYQQQSPGGVREYPVLGRNDSRHVLKRFTAQHFLGTRTIYHGCLPVDALVMLRNKMPLKAFALRDEMSDQASWQRLCPRFLDASWASCGCRAHILLGSILSSVWNAHLSPTDTFQAASLGYYLLLLHLSENKWRFGDSAESKSLPPQTVQDCCVLCGHAMIAALSYDPAEPWSLKTRQEFISEIHFGRVKAPFRGAATVRDGLWGTLLHHWTQLRRVKREGAKAWPARSTANPLKPEHAEKLAKQSLKDAVLLQTCLSRTRSPEGILSQLEEWWKEELYEDEEKPEATEDGEANAVKQQIEDLEEGVEADTEAASSVTQDATTEGAAAQELANALVEGEAEGPEDAHIIRSLLGQLRQIPSWPKDWHAQTSAKQLLQRLQEMAKLVDDYIRAVRLQERFLSKVQIDNETTQLHRYNEIEHQLALARQASSICLERCSRVAGWHSVQQQWVEEVQGAAADAPVQMIHHYGSYGRQQFLLYLKSDGTVGRGLALTAYRGAVLKKGDLERKKKVTKPSCSSLTLAQCANLRILDLLQRHDDTWTACLLNDTLLMDPCGRVLAEILPTHVVADGRCLHARFSAQALKLPEDFIKKEAWKKEPAATPAASAAPVPALAGLTFHKLTPQLAPKNVPIYLQQLPEMYLKRGTEILEDDGEYKITATTDLDWSELSARAVGLFDVLLQGQSGATFGKGVLTKLRSIHPEREDGRKQLHNFVGQVHRLAAPCPIADHASPHACLAHFSVTAAKVSQLESVPASMDRSPCWRRLEAQAAALNSLRAMDWTAEAMNGLGGLPVSLSSPCARP